MSNLLLQIYVKLKNDTQFWIRHEKRSQRCESSTSLFRFYLTTIFTGRSQYNNNTRNKAYVRFFRAGSTWSEL